MRPTPTVALGAIITAGSLLLCTPRVGSSQVTDTLDWKRYFPLTVGNEWQYTNTREVGARFERWVVVKDTLIASQPYRVLVLNYFDSDKNLLSSFRLSVRYDDESASVLVRNKLPDGTERDLWLQQIPCGLDAPLFSIHSCTGEAAPMQYEVGGWFDTSVPVGAESVPTPLAKLFVSLGGETLMAADIGLVHYLPEGASSVTQLEFARVDGRELGFPVVPTSTDSDVPMPDGVTLEIYPNPAPAGGTIHISSAMTGQGRYWAALYDLTGRQVKGPIPIVSTLIQEAQLGLDGLASGVYVLQLQTGASSAARVVHVVH